jgi:hypothetical protein
MLGAGIPAKRSRLISVFIVCNSLCVPTDPASFKRRMSPHPWISLPLTMYRQIEKMSIYSVARQQRVHKYNAKNIENAHPKALVCTGMQTVFCEFDLSSSLVHICFERAPNNALKARRIAIRPRNNCRDMRIKIANMYMYVLQNLLTHQQKVLSGCANTDYI